MPGSNYPPGMSRRDMDHVEGVIRCEDCGTDITAELEDLPEDAPLRCPNGCWTAEDEKLDKAGL